MAGVGSFYAAETGHSGLPSCQTRCGKLADRPVHIRVETSSVWTDSGVQFGALLYGQTRENSHNHGIAEQLLRSSPNTKLLSKMVSSVRNQYDEKALL